MIKDRRLIALAAVSFAIGACGSTSPTPASSIASPAPTPTVLPSAQASPSTDSSANVPPSDALPSPSDAPTPSAAACADVAQNGLLPSDRFTDIELTKTDSGERLTFVFARSSIGSPAGPPRGAISVAPAPYTFAGSGESIDMDGDQVLLVRFRHMSLSNDVGQETFTGPRELHSDAPGFRQAVLFDESEGVIGWYVGYDGPGCVTVGQGGRAVTLSFER